MVLKGRVEKGGDGEYRCAADTNQGHSGRGGNGSTDQLNVNVGREQGWEGR